MEEKNRSFSGCCVCVSASTCRSGGSDDNGSVTIPPSILCCYCMMCACIKILQKEAAAAASVEGEIKAEENEEEKFNRPCLFEIRAGQAGGKRLSLCVCTSLRLFFSQWQHRKWTVSSIFSPRASFSSNCSFPFSSSSSSFLLGLRFRV